MKANSTNRYILIIKIVALAHIILGILLPFLAQIDSVGQLLVIEMFNGITLARDAQLQAAYVISLFGPTVASWGVLLLILIKHYEHTPTQQTWRGLVIAILVWYIGDTTYSLLNGVAAALILNSLVAVSLLVPLWKIRSLSHDE